MKVNKDKKGGGDKASVAELSPWPSYIVVCVLGYCDLLIYFMYSNSNCKYSMCVCGGSNNFRANGTVKWLSFLILSQEISVIFLIPWTEAF
jgi:hypothetical protein